MYRSGRCEQLWNEPEEKHGSKSLDQTDKILFKQLSFSYPGSQVSVIQDACGEFKVGTLYGISGHDGSGKVLSSNLSLESNISKIFEKIISSSLFLTIRIYWQPAMRSMRLASDIGTLLKYFVIRLSSKLFSSSICRTCGKIATNLVAFTEPTKEERLWLKLQ